MNFSFATFWSAVCVCVCIYIYIHTHVKKKKKKKKQAYMVLHTQIYSDTFRHRNIFFLLSFIMNKHFEKIDDVIRFNMINEYTHTHTHTHRV